MFHLLVEQATQRLKPRYQHASSDFPVPLWHVVAEALKLGWGFPYEYSTSPHGGEAAVSLDPESGRTVSIADDAEEPGCSVEVWFDHETDPYGADPVYCDADTEGLIELIRCASCYLAHGERVVD